MLLCFVLENNKIKIVFVMLLEDDKIILLFMYFLLIGYEKIYWFYRKGMLYWIVFE